MLQLQSLLRKSKYSAFWRRVLNIALRRAIPFNNPHGLTITDISDEHIRVRLPYKRANLNHLKGLHACGLATLCEYACGLLLISHVGADRYRIIMKDLSMEYHFQGKTDGIVNFNIDRKVLEEEIIQGLQHSEQMLKSFSLEVYDTAHNHLCTARVNWQIKSWDKVKTKV